MSAPSRFEDRTDSPRLDTGVGPVPVLTGSSGRRRPLPGPSAVPRAVVVLAVVAMICLALPILALAVRADWRTVPGAATSPAALQALGLSLRTSAGATVASLVLGLPLALFLARWKSRWSNALRALVMVPLVLPPMVGGVALLYLLGRGGLLGGLLSDIGIRLPFTTTAVVIAQTFVAMPFLVLSVDGSLRALGSGYESAAATLGAGPFRVLRTITIPLLLPALGSGTVLCFARALGEFGATALFAGNRAGVTRTMPLAIYTAFNGGEAGQEPVAIALSLMLVVVAGLIMAVTGRWRSREIP